MSVHRSGSRSRAVHAAGAALALLLSTSISGCSVMGFSLGALSDHAVGKGGPSHLLNARRGVHVTLWLNDGRKLTGVYEDVLPQQGMVAVTAASDSVVVSGYGAAASPTPPFTGIVLLTNSGERDTIPAGSVERVSIPNARGKVKGLIGGLVIDALLVAALFGIYSGGFE